jgi:uncharacterized protein (DUF1810 family)
MSLDRFLTAQNKYYRTALKEVENGKKESHWMWFIFPQIKGLGYSDISKYFSIQSRSEAKAYLAHPVLGKRLERIAEALMWLETNDPVEVFGCIDAIKLQASMTLFFMVSRGDVFADVLVKYFNGVAHWETVEILRDMEG